MASKVGTVGWVVNDFPVLDVNSASGLPVKLALALLPTTRGTTNVSPVWRLMSGKELNPVNVEFQLARWAQWEMKSPRRRWRAKRGSEVLALLIIFVEGVGDGPVEFEGEEKLEEEEEEPFKEKSDPSKNCLFFSNAR